MKKKRNLLEELDIKGQSHNSQSPLDIDIEKIKGMVNNSIDSSYSERKFGVMKSKKKFSFIAAAAILVLGITAFAASGIITNWYSGSSSIPEYKSLPTAERCIEDVGYAPVLIETFDNGYKFKSGSVIDNNLTDENNNSVEKFKSVMFRYEKDGDTLNFSQEKFDSGINNIGDIIVTVGDVDVYYHGYTNKIVPPDYKMTEEDKKAEENGDLVFSWGSDKVKIAQVQSAVWTEDGTHYVLMQIDGKLSADDLADMAKEVIEK